MIKIPPYLEKGDTIGLVCPAGFMALEKVQDCIAALQEWGYSVRLGATVGGDSLNYFSGDDEKRRKDFQLMLDDKEVKAILCARGGYGMGRIIERIDFSKFKKRPKWIIGFSDITVLHAHLYSNYYISSIHGPMASAFSSENKSSNSPGSAEEGMSAIPVLPAEPAGRDFKSEYVLSLKNALEGRKLKYQCAVHEFNRYGEAIGELVGGNLSLLTHIVGTSSDLKTKGRILFIEDTGEYLYNIDRMLCQLKRNNKLSKLAGLIVGGFTDNKDTERPYGQTAYEIISHAVKEYDFPVCYGFPVSHEMENVALKTGTGYKLKVTKARVMLEE